MECRWFELQLLFSLIFCGNVPRYFLDAKVPRYFLDGNSIISNLSPETRISWRTHDPLASSVLLQGTSSTPLTSFCSTAHSSEKRPVERWWHRDISWHIMTCCDILWHIVTYCDVQTARARLTQLQKHRSFECGLFTSNVFGCILHLVPSISSVS